ncbi:MAG: hypothetical protein HKP54_02695, partial [Boseongicola sp.]|nr:hypothetical protein [Boseongicola sp.]
MVFGAGILLGVGLMQFQGSSGLETPAPSEDVAARSSVEDTAVVETAPAPSEQVIAQTPVEDDVPVEQPVAEATTEAAPRVEPLPEPADQVVAGLTPEEVADEPTPEPAEQAVAGSTSDAATTVEPTPQPVEQTASEVAVAPLTFDQVSVLSAPRAEGSSFSAGFPATFTSPSLPPSVARLELLDANAIDAVPAVGAAPEYVAPEANLPEPEEAPEVLDTLAALSANDSDTLPDDAGTLPAIISDEGRAVQQLDDISRLDNAPASLESSLVPEIAGTDDVAAPSPIVTDGIERPLWIFAPGSVSDEVLETTRSTAENLNLSVQAINRVNFRISTNQVRYYDQASSAAAEQLAARLDAVPRDFTTSGIDAQPG